MRLLLAAGLATLALGAGPASAAVTVSSAGGEIRAQASPGEATRISVTSTTEYIQFTALEPTGTAPGPGCEAVATGGVRCDRRGVRHVLAELGDLDDHLGVSLDVPNDPPLTYSGGDGTDAVDYGAGPVTVTLDGDDDDGRRGRDDIRPDVEQVVGTVTADTLTGSAGANSLIGDAGADTLSGLAGDDFVDALDFVDCESEGDCERPEIDTISCGEGFDTADVDSTDAVATDCELIARASVIGGTDAADTIAAWRPALQIFSGAGDDRITGPGLNTLNAGSGNDYVRVFGNSGSSLTGGSGDDRVISGRGGDFISGGYGDDRLYGYNGKDEIQGGAGRDVIYGGARNDRITSRERGDQRDVVNCGSGRDVVIADRRDRISRNCERVMRG